MSIIESKRALTPLTLYEVNAVCLSTDKIIKINQNIHEMHLLNFKYIVCN